jgi:hypothetical protein
VRSLGLGFAECSPPPLAETTRYRCYACPIFPISNYSGVDCYTVGLGPSCFFPKGLGKNKKAGTAATAANGYCCVKRFDAGTSLKWVRHFRGRLDDVSEVLLSLGYDGNNCRGQLTYIESKEQFDLTGTLEGMVLLLNESDSKGMITGHLTGTLQNDRIEAEWTNAVNTLGVAWRPKR